VSASNGTRILVVEDDEDNALLMEEVLREAGFEVEVAHDGTSALAAAERMRPDVGLLDLGLPDMDGFELATRLRSMADGKSLRLIALSGYGSDEDVKRALLAGFDLHMTKPILPAALANTLAAQSPQSAGDTKPRNRS
jgi:CheY-like chemotaxis protein